MTENRQNNKLTRYILPKWVTPVAWFLFIVITYIDVITEPVLSVSSFTSLLVINLLGIAGFFVSVKKAYSLAKEIDSNGLIAILLCIFFNFIGLFLYWIYYSLKKDENGLIVFTTLFFVVIIVGMCIIWFLLGLMLGY